ncbi:MAG TPA: hypothetical protein VGQ37_17300 [Vicinamibacterales bacterium]|nr:hypothetical protein [Vicinamibacterales bacterium]
MRIFFSMWHLGSFRMHEPVIRDLAGRGHEIHIALGRAEGLGWGKALDNLVADCPGVTWSWLSPPTAAFWAEIGKTIRLWVDYLRYFHPDYDETPKLKARAEERLPPRLVQISHRPAFRAEGSRRRWLALLRTLERALPPVPEIDAELQARRPDLLVVTPLVYLGSSQFEVLRAALARGIRTVYAVGSWDHLSSKALIRDMPQRVFVWNQTQKTEAVRLHGVPPDRVVVTGAQCYDQWFGRQPVRSRADFCRRVGLSDDRPYLLYVCSALFWGSPVEAEFVRRWVQSLRESQHPELHEVGVLIRPHPARMDEWNAIDLSPFAHVTLYGSNPVDDASKDDYFESLYYSSAIVGLNTSAFLEGAVVGRPVHTVLLPEFHENQEGVLHFHYLLTVGGGVLQTGRTFEQHHDRLLESLRHPPAAPGAEFVREFIRPAGLEVPATPVFSDAIEALLREPTPAPVRTPAVYTLVRGAMYPAFKLLRAVYGADLIRDDWSRKEREHQERKAARDRAREERRQQAEAVKAEQVRRRAETRAAREAAEREQQQERERAVAAKASLKQAKARDKEARARQRRRAEVRAGLKRRAARLFERVR